MTHVRPMSHEPNRFGGEYLEHEYDELADDDVALLNDLPMRVIRLQYVTLGTERDLLTDTLERLGLGYVEINHQYFAVNESDSIKLRIDATEHLMAEGHDEPTDAQIAMRMTRLLTMYVLDSAGEVSRSTLRDPLLTARVVGAQLRAEAEAMLLERETLRRKAIARLSIAPKTEPGAA